uniref:Coiled-coil domain containing 163 n=1 Tax=Rousettus aegyptiacus TaxID=9407 RepID=A0A7J8K5U9_ROUAE|nr:coiled-coil domain containing 163 [Rousettus aegyptiacus]
MNVSPPGKRSSAASIAGCLRKTWTQFPKWRCGSQSKVVLSWPTASPGLCIGCLGWESKEATRSEAQDAQREQDLLRTSIHVLQSKLPQGATFAMSLSSSSSEVSLPDGLQKSTLSNMEHRNFQL